MYFIFHKSFLGKIFQLVTVDILNNFINVNFLFSSGITNIPFDTIHLKYLVKFTVLHTCICIRQGKTNDSSVFWNGNMPPFSLIYNLYFSISCSWGKYK